MPVIRVKFSKEGNLSYISHLSLMKVFERAIRRAELPISYSKGFNPHPRMVFSSPLSLGISSESEYADFEVDTDISAVEFSRKLSAELPNGMDILNATVLDKDEVNIMRATAAATYEILVSSKGTDLSYLKNEIENIKSREKIVVEKKSKSKINETDIKKMIKQLDIYELSDSQVSQYTKDFCEENKDESLSYWCIIAEVSAGTEENLNCELLFNTINENLKVDLVTIHRTEMYIKRHGEIVKAIW